MGFLIALGGSSSTDACCGYLLLRLAAAAYCCSSTQPCKTVQVYLYSVSYTVSRAVTVPEHKTLTCFSHLWVWILFLCTFPFHKYIFTVPIIHCQKGCKPFCALILYLYLLLVMVPCITPINKCKLSVQLEEKKKREDKKHPWDPNWFHFSLSVPPLNLQVISQWFAALN